ncbi:MAG TPA: phosphocholine cytidylyltransferase family protein [Candidatus Aenigmarchaeota archaeon]|nr:phosphocholine cytidylyltransferase family protein [Candidatus Aenigmarchaeota archaeon]
MKALIIAAGQGSRLKELTNHKPKPLIQLLGRSLIERVILNIKQAGINEFVIVIGYLGDKIKAKLRDGKKYGVKIQYVENKEWDKENGISVLKAKEALKNENFILTMSDHVFEPRMVKELLKLGADIKNECILCVDKSLSKNYIDLDDATKVRVDNGYILDIGKGLKEYNAIDCGVFLCTPIIFKALEKSIKNGNATLSGGIAVLAKERRMKAFDIKNIFWMDIDTPEDLKNAEFMLKEKSL